MDFCAAGVGLAATGVVMLGVAMLGAVVGTFIAVNSAATGATLGAVVGDLMAAHALTSEAAALGADVGGLVDERAPAATGCVVAPEAIADIPTPSTATKMTPRAWPCCMTFMKQIPSIR